MDDVKRLETAADAAVQHNDCNALKSIELEMAAAAARLQNVKEECMLEESILSVPAVTSVLAEIEKAEKELTQMKDGPVRLTATTLTYYLDLIASKKAELEEKKRQAIIDLKNSLEDPKPSEDKSSAVTLFSYRKSLRMFCSIAQLCGVVCFCLCNCVKKVELHACFRVFVSQTKPPRFLRRLTLPSI